MGRLWMAAVLLLGLGCSASTGDADRDLDRTVKREVPGDVLLETYTLDLTWGYKLSGLYIAADGKTYPLIRGVESFSVTLEPMRSPSAARTGAGWDLLRRATVQMTVRTTEETSMATEGVGRITLTLSGSVMPRRNTW